MQMLPVNVHEVKDIVFEVIVSCSVIHTFLPPWDAPAIAAFPSLQKTYRLFIYIVGYVAINARSTVYKSISVENPTGVNGNAVAKNGGNGH